MTPLVSVLIPCYNDGKFLAEAVESVLAQDYHSIEVLILDDGSTDDTEIIARKYKDSTRYVRLPHGGLSATRNAGLEIIEGEFWCNLDADNLMKPGFISEMVHALQLSSNPPLDFVYCQREYFGTASLEGTCSQFPEHDLSAFKLRNYIDSSCIMVRTSSSRNIRFDPTLPRWVDFDYFLTFLKQGARCRLVDQPLVHYRVHGKSLSGQITNSKRRKLAKQFMKKHGRFYNLEEKKSFFNHIRNSIIRRVQRSRKEPQSFGQRIRGGWYLMVARGQVQELALQIFYIVMPKVYAKWAEQNEVRIRAIEGRKS